MQFKAVNRLARSTFIQTTSLFDGLPFEVINTGGSLNCCGSDYVSRKIVKNNLASKDVI